MEFRDEDIAPVALFVYNRPQHTKRVLMALSKANLIDRSELYVFIDGPKDSDADRKSNEEVRMIIGQISFARKVSIFQNETNKGLCRSVVDGLNMVLSLHDRVIVLEDDIVVSTGFLDFMNVALIRHKNDPVVMHIGGYMPKIHGRFDPVVLIQLTHSWGWATWDDRWRHFDMSADRLLDEIQLRNLSFKFNYNGSYRFTRMLRRAATGKRDSWLIRWYASVFLRGGLCLNPTKSLVENIGHDNSGTHSFKTKSFDPDIVEDVREWSLESLEESSEVRLSLMFFFVKQRLLFGWKYYLQLLRK